MANAECKDYKPGETMGKNRPICKYWGKYNNGVCTSGKQFMCIYYIEKWLKEHPVKEESNGNHGSL